MAARVDRDSRGDRDYKVIVVGSPKVGKTSLIQRYLFQEFSYDVPPTSSEERKVVTVGEKQVPLLICDLAGNYIATVQPNPLDRTHPLPAPTPTPLFERECIVSTENLLKNAEFTEGWLGLSSDDLCTKDCPTGLKLRHWTARKGL